MLMSSVRCPEPLSSSYVLRVLRDLRMDELMTL